MLKTLDIENIAVIEKTTVDFSCGLNVLTGETGAGKSIVVDSINAILGERTSKELIRHGSENAYVSAYFTDIADSVKQKLDELGYDCEEDDSLLITRKISLSGKSGCKINGKSATVSILKELGTALINIHGQNDSQQLLNPDYQYKYIDLLFDDKSYIDEYKASFKELISVRRQLKALTNDEYDKEKELELLEYQIKELEDADIKIGERDELNKRKSLILKSEGINNALNGVLAVLNGSDNNEGLTAAVNSCFNSLVGIDEAKPIADIFSNAYDSLETAKDKIELLLDELDFDASELEQIEERLDLLYRFSLKYAGTEEGILEFLQKAKEKRNSIVYSDRELERLSAEYDSLLEKTVKLADKLSSYRKKVAQEFESKVKSELEFLDMPKLKFLVDFQKSKLTSNGYDKIEFLISTNVGEPPKPLAKIASGGELSRIMLAIKNIISSHDTVATLIFDEIDTGVSGRASQKIGLKLKSVSRHNQVICVTHSAQIASNADEHFLIEKSFVNDKTYTSVKPLDNDGRKYELARIMGGLEITDALLKSAQELLNNN